MECCEYGTGMGDEHSRPHCPNITDDEKKVSFYNNGPSKDRRTGWGKKISG